MVKMLIFSESKITAAFQNLIVVLNLPVFVSDFLVIMISNYSNESHDRDDPVIAFT